MLNRRNIRKKYHRKGKQTLVYKQLCLQILLLRHIALHRCLFVYRTIRAAMARSLITTGARYPRNRSRMRYTLAISSSLEYLSLRIPAIQKR